MIATQRVMRDNASLFMFDLRHPPFICGHRRQRDVQEPLNKQAIVNDMASISVACPLLNHDAQVEDAR